MQLVEFEAPCFAVIMIDCCNSEGKEWKAPKTCSISPSRPVLPITKASCPRPKSLFVQVMPSAAAPSNWIVLLVFWECVEVAWFNSEMLLLASLFNQAALCSLEICDALYFPSMLDKYEEVAFEVSQNSAKNVVATSSAKQQTNLSVCQMLAWVR